MAHALSTPRSKPATARLVGVARRGRSALLLGTALQASTLLLLAVPARAQPAANARPSQGVVTAGSASIATSASTTTIKQSSQQTAINWQSFDVGSQQTVDFIQPSSSAVALNRVISGNPSQIAGRIDANGQVILINQSGVIFYQGAQVNTAGLIVSAAGMSDVNFMAGKLVFDQAAHPNAAVVNQGSLTVQQAGLAALVAPQVANSGVITAQLGHVVLAGAKTATLDLYGDGLVSLDVTNQVTRAPVGRGGAPATALVTNTGVIQADGGTVQLTAREADGLVQTLVQAGGRISADSVGSKTGAVVLGGLGGSIVLSGVVTADGSTPGSAGGQVQVDASQAVTLAAGSRVSASGPAGGGTVAIGTTLARAAGGPGTPSTLTTQTVQVAQGASIDANATSNGDGGRVTVLSSLSTSMSGSINALGGKHGGNGGFIETSGHALSIADVAVVSAAAPKGVAGTWLLDPYNVTISTDNTLAIFPNPIVVGTSNYSATDVNAQANNQQIENALNGGTNISINTGPANGPQAGTITVNAPVAWTTAATLTLTAASTITINLPISGSNAGSVLTLNAGGTVSQAATGIITVGTLTGNSVGGATLNKANKVSTLGPWNDTGAGSTGLNFVNAQALQTSGALSSTGPLSLTTTAGSITLNGNVVGPTVNLVSATTIGQLSGAITAGALTGQAAGDVTLTLANDVSGLGTFTVTNGGSFSLTDSGLASTLAISGPVTATNVTISGAPSVTADGSIGATDTLSLTSGAGGITLDGGAVLTGQTVNLDGGSGGISLIGNALVGQANAVVDLTAGAGGVTEFNSSSIVAATLQGNVAGPVLLGNGNTVLTLGSFTVTGPGNAFQLDDNGTLAVTGPLTATGDVGLNVIGTGSGNAITVTGLISSGGTLSAGSGLGALALQSGAVLTAPTISLQADGITLTGNASVGGSGSVVELGSFGGFITEASTSTIIATTLQTTALGSAGSVSLLGTGNVIGALGTFTLFGSSGDSLTLIDSIPLTVTGPVTANNPPFNSQNVVLEASGSITVTAPITASGNIILATGGEGPITPPPATANPLISVQAAAVTSTGGSVSLLAGPGGTVQLGVPSASATVVAGSGQLVTLQMDTLSVAGPASGITAPGGTVEIAPATQGDAIDFATAASNTLTIPASAITAMSTGTLRIGAVTINGTETTTAGAIAFDAAVDLTGHATTLQLLASGAVSEPGGPLTANTLIGSAGSVVLDNNGNNVATLGSFTTTSGGFDLNDTGNTGALNVTGPVTAATIATINTGATGAIDVTGGIGAGSLLALISGSGGITLSGNATLTGPTIDLAASAGPIALNGNSVVGQSGAAINLTTTGNITQAASSTLIAATLQTAGGAVVDLAGTANAVGALDSVIASTSFTLNDSTNLTVNDELLAPRIALLAPGQTVTLSAGATIITDGTPPPSPPGPLLPADEPSNGAPGAYIEAASFTQVGTSMLITQGTAGPTLQISTTNRAQFDPSLGLQAPTGWLILNLGSGTAAGNVALNALNVTYTMPGSANLTGTIAGTAGAPAAAAGFIQPAVNANYLFNGCEISSAACVPVPPPSSETPELPPLYPYLPAALPPLPGLPPLQLLALPLATPACTPAAPGTAEANRSEHTCALTDPDVVPPNVSYVDY